MAGHKNPLCNALGPVAFAKAHLADAQALAKQVDVPAENILGLAAQESQWGEGRIAKTYNNYFSMHAPAPGQTGDTPALGDPKVRVAVFDSFLQCGQSFIDRFGDGVRGKQDPTLFAQALVKVNFNTGNSKTGGRDDFVAYLAKIITNVGIRLQCD